MDTLKEEWVKMERKGIAAMRQELRAMIQGGDV